MTRAVVARAVGVVGALVYAGAGAVMGAVNAGWLSRETNDMLPVLGVGAGLVVVAVRSTDLNAGLDRAGPVGDLARYLLVAGPVLYLVGWLIEFAIFGTFALGLGLVCLAVAVWRGRVMTTFDRVLVAVSAIGSLTWNTETVSAFLLVGVGLAWVALVLRASPAAGAT